MRNPPPHDRGRSASTPIDLSDNSNDDESAIIDLTGDEASDNDSSGEEDVQVYRRPPGKDARRSRRRRARHRSDERAEVVKSRKRRNESSSSQNGSESDSDGEGGEYYFPEPRHIRFSSQTPSGSESSDSANSDTNGRRPQSHHHRRRQASDTESNPPSDSDDSESDDDADHQHDHDHDPEHELPHSCPDPEQYAEIYARLRRSGKAARLRKWLRDHPRGDIDLHKIQDLVFPHPWIRRFIGDDMPKSISGEYRSLLPRLHEFAVSLFKPLRHHTMRSKAYRLRMAVASLAFDRPRHTPACDHCKEIGVPCVDLGPWEPKCWDCKVHARKDEACSVIRAYRGSRRRVDAASELEAELRQHMVVEESGHGRRKVATKLVDELGYLLDNPHGYDEKRELLGRLNNHALADEPMPERRGEADQLLRRVTRFLRDQPKTNGDGGNQGRNRFKRPRIATSEDEDDAEDLLDDEEDEGDGEDDE